MSNVCGWVIRLSHEGLHTYRVIRGATKEEVEHRARLQKEAWDARWARFQAAESARQQRINKRQWNDRQADIDRRARDEALKLAKEAENELSIIKSLLSSALGKNHELDWKSLRDTTCFTEPEPLPPQLATLPLEPVRTNGCYEFEPVISKIGFADWIVPGARRKKLNEAETLNRQRRNEADKRLQNDHANWMKQCENIRNKNESSLANHHKAKAAWHLAKQVFYEKQKRFNLEMEDLEKQYLNRSEAALKRYCAEVLVRSEYPEAFPKDCAIVFESEGSVLVVDYELPPQHVLPNVRNVKYSAPRKEFQKTLISDAESKRLYDDVLYQVCLRTLYELFQADKVNMIESIVFNDWVDAVDKATGADTHPCVMTVQVAKAEFMALNLSQIDLKACFRSLKGISGAKLIDFTPVRPVLALNREDPRFVPSYTVVEGLDDQTNLAAMDWLDFENLIRELFEKEFSKDGGEVKITQASRDGGVDAIAFEPRSDSWRKDRDSGETVYKHGRDRSGQGSVPELSTTRVPQRESWLRPRTTDPTLTNSLRGSP